jgi:C-terminal processing protease CtpA/Prc
MNILRAIGIAALVSALACAPLLAQSTGLSEQNGVQMTAASRQQLIDKLIKEVNSSYVFPDMAKKVETSLRQQQKRGAYDTIANPQRLSEVLTDELQAATNDRHLRVTYSKEVIADRKSDDERSPEEAAGYLAMMRSNNFGVERVERLPFNIGYLELGGFASANDAAETLAATMALVNHTNALIIDLRNNGGGDAAAVTLLASYLFDKRTQLNDFYFREGNRTEQRWTADVVPGLRYGGAKPVYILTSKDTFSAAEDFTYALKNLKRATVVGETTGGGANQGDDRRLSPNFSLFVPLDRVISPVTKTNW